MIQRPPRLEKALVGENERFFPALRIAVVSRPVFSQPKLATASAYARAAVAKALANARPQHIPYFSVRVHLLLALGHPQRTLDGVLDFFLSVHVLPGATSAYRLPIDVNRRRTFTARNTSFQAHLGSLPLITADTT